MIGVCSDGLPPKHFLEAMRPAISVLTDREILQRLTRHSSSMTLLVMDADGMQDAPRQQSLKSCLCWDLTDLLFTMTAPDLVFWCGTDTLYAAEEFDRACTYMSAQDTPTRPRKSPSHDAIPAHFNRDPEISGDALAGIETPAELQDPDQPAPRQAHRGGQLRKVAEAGTTVLDVALSLVLPNRAVIGLNRIGAGLDRRRALRGLAMACSTAAIGIGGLSQLPGWY